MYLIYHSRQKESIVHPISVERSGCDKTEPTVYPLNTYVKGNIHALQ